MALAIRTNPTPLEILSPSKLLAFKNLFNPVSKTATPKRPLSNCPQSNSANLTTDLDKDLIATDIRINAIDTLIKDNDVLAVTADVSLFKLDVIISNNNPTPANPLIRLSVSILPKAFTAIAKTAIAAAILKRRRALAFMV